MFSTTFVLNSINLSVIIFPNLMFILNPSTQNLWLSMVKRYYSDSLSSHRMTLGEKGFQDDLRWRTVVLPRNLYVLCHHINSWTCYNGHTVSLQYIYKKETQQNTCWSLELELTGLRTVDSVNPNRGRLFPKYTKPVSGIALLYWKSGHINATGYTK